jgi:general secretion pathway protein D
VPELKPLNPQPINLKMNNKTKVLFDTVAKYAGVNLLWDPEYKAPTPDGFNVELNDSTIEQSLDYLALLTKSFWQAISANTIFVTNESQQKRQAYEGAGAQGFLPAEYLERRGAERTGEHAPHGGRSAKGFRL